MGAWGTPSGVLAVLALTVTAVVSTESEKPIEVSITHAANLGFGDFEKQVRHGRVLLQLYAGWCGVCRHFAPVYDELAAELAGHGVRVVKVDADRYKVIASRFKLSGFPAFYLIENGTVYRFEGERTLKALHQFAMHKKYAKAMNSGVFGPLSPVWRGVGYLFALTNYLVDQVRSWKLAPAALVMLSIGCVTGVLGLCALLVGVLSKPKME